MNAEYRKLNGIIYQEENVSEQQDEHQRYQKFNRVLSIFERLYQGDLINKKLEAARFGVNEKTIQRDIEDVRAYLAEMFPDERQAAIDYDRSKNGYIMQRDKAAWLSNQEILLIAKVLLEGRALNKEEINSLLDKLIIQSSPQERKYIKEIISNERFHYMPLKHNQPLLEILWELSMASREQRIVKISYCRIGDEKIVERIVEPQGVLFSEYYFYLMAYIQGIDYNCPTIYRLDRITEYEIAREHFKTGNKPRFEGGEARKRIQFMQSGKLLTIRFRFWGESLEAVLDRLPTAKIIDQDEKGTVVEAQVFGRGIKMWLLSQAEFLEVLKPADLREEMKEAINRMSIFYL